MGSTRIIYSPLTGFGAAAQTLDLGTHPTLTELDGGLVPTRTQSITVGGVAVTLFHDTRDEYTVEMEAISKTVDVDVYQKIMAWWAMAQQGVEFSLALDSAKVGDETLTGAHAQAVTAITISDTTDFAAGDWCRIISATNPGVINTVEIDTIDTGTTLTLERATQFGFAGGDTFRHVDYFPTCIYVGTKPPLTERGAGDGANLWDLEFTFRSVR